MMTSQADKIREYMENFVEDKIEEVATAAFEELVELTPVSSGRLRAGWKMKRGEINKTVPKLRKGKYRKPRTPKIAKPTPGADNKIYISNGVPYILEANSGSKDRAPTRFVQSAIARAVEKFRGGGSSF